MTLTFKLDLDSVTMDQQHAKYLGQQSTQRSFGTDTHIWIVNLSVRDRVN